ncbi:MAG: efflux RND transporter periplasmic adaptor subunit [Bacteroidota bacterium]|nr:efflux RND transporter periplasmic adaptor subunit [Bacteroidota bacterium]
MKKNLIPFMALILLTSCSSKEGSPQLTTMSDTIAVKVVPIVAGSSLNVIRTSGLLSTRHEARLSFKVGGVIDHIYVSEGQRVHQGEILASLNATEIGAQVAQAKLALEKAHRDYQRAQNLYNDSVVTLEQLQNAQTGLDMATESYQQAIFNQRYAKIVAPASGFIIKKLSNQGEITGPGIPVIVMNITSGTSQWVLKTGVSDKEWAAISLGDSAQVQFDGLGSKPFAARVTNRSMAADPATGSFEIELKVDFKKEVPGAGMFGRAVIYPSQTIHSVTIPYLSLLDANGKQGFVFVTDDRKTALKVPVVISEINTNSVTIASGLEGHSLLITSGSPFLQNHSPISIKH